MIFALLDIGQNLSAQRFIGSAILGMNACQIEGDDVHGFYKIGVNGGAGVTLPLNRKQTWSVSAELLYTQKGSYKRYLSAGAFDTTNYAPSMFTDVDRTKPFNNKLKCNISLDYVQIPVIFHYEDMTSGCSFGLGFSWSRLVRAKEVYNGFTRTTNVRSHTYNISDWSFLADANIRLYKNLTLNVRWEYSLVPIRTVNFDYQRNDGTVDSYINKMHNHLVSLRLIYYINEKFVPNTHYNRKGNLVGTKFVRDIPDY